jgi:cystathionine beta-synthase
MKYDSLLAAIGHTPLVDTHFNPRAKTYAKLEYLNPGGSVKDRSALFMIEEAERRGILKPGGTIIDASSGNQGIAAAMIGAIKGYNVIITVSEKISNEKYKAIKAYGAQVVMCPANVPMDHPENYHKKALAIHKATPNSFMPNQYYNIDNRMAHYRSLGPEIWQQTEGQITHFFAAAGTGGTVSGAGSFLKEQNPNIKIFAVDSINSYRSTKGNPKPYAVEGMGVDFDTPVLKYDVIDEFIEVSDNDALGMLKTLAVQQGFLVGPSSGAVAFAVQQYAPKLPDNSVAVFICGDSGRAYLSKNFYAEDPVRPAQEIPQKKTPAVTL